MYSITQSHCMRCLYILLSFLVHNPIFAAQVDPKVAAIAKRSVVTIKGHASLAAYDELSRWEGTGFIVDKQKGYLLTNEHIIGGSVVGSYDIIFYDGTQTKAKVLYYDSWVDYGFLQIDPTTIPSNGVAIKCSNQKPRLNHPIFIVGNNETQGFSIHVGVVADLYTIEGKMPQQAMRLSLNTKGGSSGSPVFNMQGEVIALNYATDGTFGLGLYMDYIHYALSFIQKGTFPIRKHIGALLGSCSLVEAVRYDNFDPLKQKEYAKKFPTASNNAIQVVTTLVGTPAAAQLLPGDIIWAVNGKIIGPHLVNLDLAMNKTEGDLLLTICRHGQWHDVSIPVYDLEAHKIKRMVQFGGVVFFEMDDYTGKILGEAAKTLTFALADAHTIFNNIQHWNNNRSAFFRLKVLGMDGIAVTNLDELVQLIPRLVAKKSFTIDYINAINFITFGNQNAGVHLGHRPYRAHVAYQNNTTEPRLWAFDPLQMEWKVSKIPCM